MYCRNKAAIVLKIVSTNWFCYVPAWFDFRTTALPIRNPYTDSDEPLTSLVSMRWLSSSITRAVCLFAIVRYKKIVKSTKFMTYPYNYIL